jgi:2-oxoglutarate ferredoxin oxidoreductase subunit alpha
MAEMPLVIVDVQRGGPSTGMPTNIEQSDLNIAVSGGHGDSPRVVIAPANVEDCFYMAIEAVNIARKYSVPVILLTDQGIATRIEAFTEPNLEKVCQDISPDFTPVADHKPYDLSAADSVTHHLAPGTKISSGKYPIVTGLEHDELGHPTGSPKMHMQMNAKRRKKLQALGATLPVPKIYGPPEGNVLLVGWGSTEGPIKEAVDRARAAGERPGKYFLRLQPHSRRRDERRGALRFWPARRAAARALLRRENPRHQQNRRSDVEGEGHSRTHQNQPLRRTAQIVNLNRASATTSKFI